MAGKTSNSVIVSWPRAIDSHNMYPEIASATNNMATVANTGLPISDPGIRFRDGGRSFLQQRPEHLSSQLRTAGPEGRSPTPSDSCSPHQSVSNFDRLDRLGAALRYYNLEHATACPPLASGVQVDLTSCEPAAPVGAVGQRQPESVFQLPATPGLFDVVFCSSLHTPPFRRGVDSGG